MEDAEGGFNFDFERGLDAPPAGVSSHPDSQQTGSTLAAAAVGQHNDHALVSAEGFRQGQGPRRTFRQTVCRHWIRGLCMKGDLCGFLHQLDRGRMPVCRFFTRYGECREPDCIFKHTVEEIKECNMYMLGFCPNGPDCRYRHVKLPGPVPSLEESYQKIQQRMAAGAQYSRYLSQRQGPSSMQGDGQPLATAVPLPQVDATGTDVQNTQQSQLPVQESQEQPHTQPLPPPPPLSGPASQQLQGPQADLHTSRSPLFLSASTPLPKGYSRYFVVKSCTRENLELSVMRGMWATHRNNEAKMNDAFESCDNVILVFSVNETGHFQGCARMESKIGEISGGGSWKYANGNTHYGRNFLLKWLKLCDLSFHKTRHLRNTYNENLPVKISRDCQELEPSVGEQLTSLLYMEPDSDLMKSANEAEAKRDEDRAKGLNSVKEEEERKTVPCDDVDADQEEQSNGDDSSSQTTSHNKGDGFGNQASRRGTHAFPRPHGRGSRLGGKGRSAFALGYDRVGANPGDHFGIPGTALGLGFPSYYPLSGYGGQVFQNVRPPTALGFGPMDSALAPTGMPFPSSRQAPNALFAHQGLGLMGPPGQATLMAGVPPINMVKTSRSHVLGAQGAGRQRRVGELLLRSSQNGGSMGLGRRVGKNQQRKPRMEKSIGASSEMQLVARGGKSLQAPDGGLGIEGVGAELEQKSAHMRSLMVAEQAESSSEDEAPRRSRYGEGKKRRREGQGEEYAL